MIELPLIMKQYVAIIKKFENQQTKLEELVALFFEPIEDKPEKGKDHMNGEENDNTDPDVIVSSNEDNPNEQTDSNFDETKIFAEFNSMITQLVNLYGNEDSDKENCPEMEENDEIDGFGAKLEINISLFGICYEWPSVTALKKHNQNLKLQLEENQFGLELIMSKYRKHFLEILNESNKACMKLLRRYNGQGCKKLQKEILQLISEMAEILTKYKEKILPSYEKIIMNQMEQINTLRVQYNGLLEIFRLSKQADYYDENNYSNENIENFDPNRKLITNSKELIMNYDPKILIELI